MNKILCLGIALAAVVSSCTKTTETPQKEKNSSFRITLVQSRAVGTPTQAEENTIVSFTVYVFENDLLEQAQTFTGVLTGDVTGLTAGAKHVAVVANPTATFPAFAIGDNYSEFALAANYIDLDDQSGVDLATTGLMMTGEDDVTLAGPPATNTLEIPLERIVAKIMLGTITVADDPLFVLTGVYITKARSLSSVGLPAIVTTPPYYGGVVGTVVEAANQRDYLIEPITIADFDERYFYVFANDNSDATATILGLAATYDGEPVYFPFEINNATTGNGTYVVRNTEYTINITVNRPFAGSTDPETPSEPATLTVNITPVDWTLVPQSVVW